MKHIIYKNDYNDYRKLVLKFEILILTFAR